ncbi:MAG: hypothetical protein IPQ04_01000 [Saprospiraceae bacterium]|nr:hypothetical protein [Saprospiraceae bacterium]
MNKSAKSSFYRWQYLFVFFFAISLFVYFPGRHGGYFTDFIGFIYMYHKDSLSDILLCWHYHSILYLFHLFNYIIYKIWGVPSIAWHIAFCLLHALVATYLFTVIKNVLTWFDHQSNQLEIAFTAALFFWVSVYHSEVVIWRACAHYMLVSLCILFSLDCIIKFLTTKTSKYFYLSFLGFAVGLLCLEFSFAIPLMIIFILIVHAWFHSEWKQGFNNIGKTILFSASILIVYSLLSKLILNKFIGHYGAEAHTAFHPIQMMSTGIKYLFKHLFLIREYDYDLRLVLFTFFEKPWFVISFYAILICGFIYSIYKKSMGWVIPIFFVIGGLIFVIPVSNLFFVILLKGENDRYGYVFFMFIAAALAYAFFRIPNPIRWAFIFGFFICNFIFLEKIIKDYGVGGDVFFASVENFPDINPRSKMLLNIPDNYRGILLHRMYGYKNHSFGEAMELFRNDPYKGSYAECILFNMEKPTDGCEIKKADKNTWHMKFKQFGNWWWKQGLGASNFENDSMKISIDQWGLAEIVLKKEMPSTDFYIFDNLHWQKVQDMVFEK